MTVPDDQLATTYDPNRHGHWVQRCIACPTSQQVAGGPQEAPRIQGGLPGLRAHYLIVHPETIPPPEEQP